MIVDRTAEDKERAIEIRDKLKLGNELSAEEYAILEKGTCTVAMLNRIGGKINELAQDLTSMFYTNFANFKSDWKNGEIFSEQDFQEMKININVLKDSYFVYKSTPVCPNKLFGYNDANDIEKILVDVENVKNTMEENYMFLGTFESGEV